MYKVVDYRIIEAWLKNSNPKVIEKIFSNDYLLNAPLFERFLSKCRRSIVAHNHSLDRDIVPQVGSLIHAILYPVENYPVTAQNLRYKMLQFWSKPRCRWGKILAEKHNPMNNWVFIFLEDLWDFSINDNLRNRTTTLIKWQKLPN